MRNALLMVAMASGATAGAIIVIPQSHLGLLLLLFGVRPALEAREPAGPALWGAVSGGILGAALFALAIFLPRAVSAHCRMLSEAAVLEERRRIACDLHDGLGQELAYLARNLDLLAEEEEADTETIGRLRRAAERAQVESRRAVRALAAPSGQVLEAALAEAVGEVAQRFDIELVLDTAPDVWLPGTRAEAMVRIACEAVTNAGRHSGASRVCVSLRRDGQRVRLLISDPGRGFDTGTDGGGFGLISMRERARAAGGELRISSAPGRGSEVEVVL